MVLLGINGIFSTWFNFALSTYFSRCHTNNTTFFMSFNSQPPSAVQRQVFLTLIHNEIIVDQVNDKFFRKNYLYFFWVITVLNYSTHFYKTISNLFKAYLRLINRENKTFILLRYRLYRIVEYAPEREILNRGLYKINVVESSLLLSVFALIG